jgi:hypothetical protein
MPKRVFRSVSSEKSKNVGEAGRLLLTTAVVIDRSSQGDVPNILRSDTPTHVWRATDGGSLVIGMH